MRAIISGVGHFAPENKLTNKDFSKLRAWKKTMTQKRQHFYKETLKEFLISDTFERVGCLEINQPSSN